MKLLTATYRTWRPGTGSPVVTSLMTPRWRPEAAAWPRCWPITPRWRHFHTPDDEFARQYTAQLDRYGAERIAAELARIAAMAYEAPSGRLVLICWEADPARCHRRQLADWWLHRTGEPIHELTT